MLRNENLRFIIDLNNPNSELQEELNQQNLESQEVVGLTTFRHSVKSINVNKTNYQDHLYFNIVV